MQNYNKIATSVLKVSKKIHYQITIKNQINIVIY